MNDTVVVIGPRARKRHDEVLRRVTDRRGRGEGGSPPGGDAVAVRADPSKGDRSPHCHDYAVGNEHVVPDLDLDSLLRGPTGILWIRIAVVVAVVIGGAPATGGGERQREPGQLNPPHERLPGRK